MKKGKLLVVTLLASSLLLSACDLSFLDDNTQEQTASLNKISVTKQPNKVTYEINETLDTTGLEVTATYSDNSTKDVTSSASIGTVDMSTAGKKNVQVSYSEGGSSVLTSFPITVNAAKIYCTISFDANGGTGSMDPLQVEKNHSFTLPANGFTAPNNKSFKAWQIGYSEYAIGTSVLASGDMTIKAVWQDDGVAPVQTYTVSFDSNGGTGSMAEQIVNEGATYTLPSCTFTAPSNKTFKAWQVGSDTTERAVGYSFTVNGNVVIKALWQNSSTPVTEFTVTYKVNGGTGSDYVVSHIQSGTSHQLVSFATTGFTAPTNKQFKNWKIGTSYYEVGASFTVTSNVTVNANYEAIKRTITFDSNGGTGTMSPVQVNSGSTYTLPSCTFTAPSGQTFKAWQVGTNTSERAAGYQFTVNSDLTIKALWKDKPTMDAWTIMLYISGNDLESRTYNGKTLGYASADISEILSVSGQPDDVNIIIQTGGAKKWASTHGISNSKLGRYYVENKKLKVDSTNSSLGDASMGATSTFQSFLEWGLTNYPAEKVGVILWNHGGALDGVCYDENHKSGQSEDRLTDDEVVSALSGAFSKLGRTEKLEFIGYDACLMQVQDIAEFNSPYFNYMVGSQESEAGEGWDYDSWVDDLYSKKSTTTILSAICDGFIDAYDKNYPQYDNDQTLSVLDLSKIDDYKTALESLGSDLKSLISSNNSAFTNILKQTKNYADSWMEYEDYYEYVYEYGYPSSWFSTETEDGVTYYLLHGYYLYGSYDVKDLLTNIKNSSKFSSVSSKCQTAINALSQLVIKNSIGNEAGNSNGLSAICKYSSDSMTTYNSGYTHFTNWRSATYNRF